MQSFVASRKEASFRGLLPKFSLLRFDSVCCTSNKIRLSQVDGEAEAAGRVHGPRVMLLYPTFYHKYNESGAGGWCFVLTRQPRLVLLVIDMYR